MANISKTYALRVGDDNFPAQKVYESLKNGIGRFGWGYIETADLRQLKVKVASGEVLNKEEKDCAQWFLLDFEPGDHTIFINVPEYGKCTIAEITSRYKWRWNPSIGDFSHTFDVNPSNLRVFDRNDAAVPPELKTRLKLLQRKWLIYAKDAFQILLDACDSGKMGQPNTVESNLSHLSRALEPFFSDANRLIHKSHPNYDLERLLKIVFEKIPQSRQVICQGGAGDQGADLIVEFETGFPVPGLSTTEKCLVQAKSYTSEHQSKKAIEDIRRAFSAYPDAHYGLIISTADGVSKDFEEAFKELQNEFGEKKQIALLVGSEVAKFILPLL